MFDQDNPIEQLCKWLEERAKPVNVYWHWIGVIVLGVVGAGFFQQMQLLGWHDARKTLAIFVFLYFVWLSLGRLHFRAKDTKKPPHAQNPPS